MKYKEYERDETYAKEESHFKNIFMTRFKIAKKFIKEAGRVLDIGTSTGAMLDIFKKSGWETWGVEPSKSSNIAIKKGHKMVNDYFEKTALPNNYFDLVIMNHTLEHMTKPLEVLKKINKLLKKDGYVLIDVPNAGGIGSILLKEKWPYRLPKEHKHQFTKTSLSRLLTRSGFKIIHSESRSGIFEFASPLREIWESLIKRKKRFFTNLINIPYDILTTLANRGDSITVVGKKI